MPTYIGIGDKLGLTLHQTKRQNTKPIGKTPNKK